MSRLVAADTWPITAERVFDVHAVLQSLRSESVAQIMEPDVTATGPLQDGAELFPTAGRVPGRISFLGEGNIWQERTMVR